MQIKIKIQNKILLFVFCYFIFQYEVGLKRQWNIKAIHNGINITFFSLCNDQEFIDSACYLKKNKIIIFMGTAGRENFNGSCTFVYIRNQILKTSILKLSDLLQIYSKQSTQMKTILS